MTGKLKEYLIKNETDRQKRCRLFLPFSSPRAVVLNKLTKKILEFVILEKSDLASSNVLDFGCGVMPYKKAFEWAGANVLGADIGSNPMADIQIGDNGLPFKDQAFDYVTSFQVLEHVYEYKRYLEEAYRILKPGGKLFLTTHGLWPYHPTPDDYHRWTSSGLIKTIESVGFKVEEVDYVLNDYSASVQFFVVQLLYNKGNKLFPFKVLHYLANILIMMLDKYATSKPNISSVILLKGRKDEK